MDIIEIVKLSLSNLYNNKLRSILTMLGIIMGIGSVILISSLGNGFQSKILSDAQTSLNNVVSISINKKYINKNEVKTNHLMSRNDITLLNNLDFIDGVTPETTSSGFEKTTETYTLEAGVDKNYNKVHKEKINLGRWFTDDELAGSPKLAVISNMGAIKLFNNENPIGKQITLENFEGNFSSYTIIGTFKSKAEGAGSLGLNNFIELKVPIKIINNKNNNVNNVYGDVLFRVNKNADIKQSINLVKKILIANKKVADDFYEIKPASDDLNVVKNILDKIALFIALIASISIIVGGIGVMNIMLVSVKERITEIGLRKAIGAKNKQILIQFLIETMILTICGGLIGILFGYSIASIIGIFIKIRPIISIKSLIASLLVSSITGIIFGIYPAKQAAKLSPIEALRKE